MEPVNLNMVLDMLFARSTDATSAYWFKFMLHRFHDQSTRERLGIALSLDFDEATTREDFLKAILRLVLRPALHMVPAWYAIEEAQLPPGFSSLLHGDNKRIDLVYLMPSTSQDCVYNIDNDKSVKFISGGEMTALQNAKSVEDVITWASKYPDLQSYSNHRDVYAIAINMLRVRYFGNPSIRILVDALFS
jgi:hypothetical protein